LDDEGDVYAPVSQRKAVIVHQYDRVGDLKEHFEWVYGGRRDEL
jgi:hypothetical protein